MYIYNDNEDIIVCYWLIVMSLVLNFWPMGHVLPAMGYPADCNIHKEK